MNRIAFTLTVADLVAAQRLHQLNGIKRTVKYLLAFTAIVLAIQFLIDDPAFREGILWGLAYLVLLFTTLILISRYWRIPRMAQRAIEQDRALAETARMSWDEATIGAESKTGAWRQQWSDFAAWCANDQTILLYRQTHLFHLVPTSAFADPAQRQSMLDMLQGNGVSKKWPPK